MYTPFRQWLFSICRFGVPAVIKKHKQRFYVMTGSNIQKYVDPFFKTAGIIFPNKIVKKDTQSIKSKSLCPTQFTFNSYRIKSLRFPHFQLIDGSAWQKI